MYFSFATIDYVARCIDNGIYIGLGIAVLLIAPGQIRRKLASGKITEAKAKTMSKVVWPLGLLMIAYGFLEFLSVNFSKDIPEPGAFYAHSNFDTRLTGTTTTGFTLSHPDGSKEVYNFIVTNTSGSVLKLLMTETWNPQGQKTRFDYYTYTPSAPV